METSNLNDLNDWPTLGEAITSMAKITINGNNAAIGKQSNKSSHAQHATDLNKPLAQDTGSSIDTKKDPEIKTVSADNVRKQQNDELFIENNGDSKGDHSLENGNDNNSYATKNKKMNGKDNFANQRASSSSGTESNPGDDTANVSSSSKSSRKKGTKHVWKPLDVELPSYYGPVKSVDKRRNKNWRKKDIDNSDSQSEHYGGRYGSSRGQSERPRNHDKSFRGGRRGRGGSRGSSFSQKSRRDYESDSPNYLYHDDYPAEIAYYVDYEPIIDPNIVALPSDNKLLPPTVVGPLIAASVPANLIPPPFYAPFAPIATPVFDPELLKARIMGQIEYYFSLENLQKDLFIRRKMDDNGWIPVSLIASFHCIKNLTQDIEMVIDAMKESIEVELSQDLLKVRTKNEPLKWPLKNIINFDASNQNDNNSEIVRVPSNKLHADAPDFIYSKPEISSDGSECELDETGKTSLPTFNNNLLSEVQS